MLSSSVNLITPNGRTDLTWYQSCEFQVARIKIRKKTISSEMCTFWEVKFINLTNSSRGQLLLVRRRGDYNPIKSLT